jgi:hypothetical protein
MSLSVGTPAPRRRAAAPRKGAPKKPAPRPAPKTAAPRMNAGAPGLVDAERLFRRFEQQLADGEHPFSVLRQGFAEWCEAGDLAPPSDIALASWLRSAGLHSYRTGRAKITIYAKRAARLAA